MSARHRRVDGWLKKVILQPDLAQRWGWDICQPVPRHSLQWEARGKGWASGRAMLPHLRVCFCVSVSKVLRRPGGATWMPRATPVGMSWWGWHGPGRLLRGLTWVGPARSLPEVPSAALEAGLSALTFLAGKQRLREGKSFAWGSWSPGLCLLSDSQSNYCTDHTHKLTCLSNVPIRCHPVKLPFCGKPQHVNDSNFLRLHPV